MKSVKAGRQIIGEGHPVYIIAEIGINHNGDIRIAKELINVAVEHGCNAVKFQKRVPEIATPEHQKHIIRETPWGAMTYLNYKKKIEFGEKEFIEIAEHCKKKGIDWFCSVWDVPSVDFVEVFNPPMHKVPSAKITDYKLLDELKATGRPIMISSGMSTEQEIDDAVERLKGTEVLIAHCTSTYPCPNNEINLKMIPALKEKYPYPIGYSGHESGLQVSVAAVALGATFIERHITLDRSLWGTDQSASVEPQGLRRLVRDIRVIEQALGDGVKKVYESEKPIMKKLRG